MAGLCRPVCLRAPGLLVSWDVSSHNPQSRLPQPPCTWKTAVISRSYRTKKNYYDVLGLTPKASSTEIKSAYYRLSKKYHPDLNTTDASKAAFAEISEAYEVLGNRRSRRLYDRGQFSHPTSGSDMGATDADYHSFIKKQGDHFRARGDAPRGRSNIFDFDEFYRQHYNDAMERQRKSAQETSRFEQQMKDDRHAKIVGFTLGTAIMTGLWMFMKAFRR